MKYKLSTAVLVILINSLPEREAKRIRSPEFCCELQTDLNNKVLI